MTKKNSFMNILVSFMNIYDHSQREAQINLWEFVAHWWTFMTPKKREAQKKKNIYASLMIFLDQKTAKRNIQKNFWFIDGHLWPKEKNIHASLWLKTATKTIHKRVGVFVFSYSKTRPNKNDIDNQHPSNKRSIHLLNNSAKKRRIVKLSSFKIVAYKRKIVLL